MATTPHRLKGWYVMRYGKVVRSAVLIVLVMVFVGGCMQKDGILNPQVEHYYDNPDTPEKLMLNFVKAYGEMDLNLYEELLHEDFVFQYQPCDIENLKLDSPWHGKREELEIAANMFSGESLRKADGRVVPAIEQAELLVDGLEQQGAAVAGHLGLVEADLGRLRNEGWKENSLCAMISHAKAFLLGRRCLW
jgi:hypothetical protein